MTASARRTPEHLTGESITQIQGATDALDRAIEESANTTISDVRQRRARYPKIRVATLQALFHRTHSRTCQDGGHTVGRNWADSVDD